MVKNFKTKTIRLLILSILCLNFLGIFLIKSPTVLAQKEEIKTIYFTPQIEIPFSAISGRTAVGSPDQDGFIVSDLLARYIKAMYDYGIMVGGILAALMLMAGGMIWLTSAGDAGKVSKAKGIITGSITGVVILMGAYFILNTINPDLVQMKGVKMIVVPNIQIKSQPTTCEESKDFNSCMRLGFCYWQEEKCIKKSDTGAVLCSEKKSDIQEKFPRCCCEQINSRYVNCKWAVGGGTTYCDSSCGQTYTQVNDVYCPRN